MRRGAILWLILLPLVAAAQVAGDAAPEPRLRALWDNATTYLGAPGTAGESPEVWAQRLVGRFMDARFMARTLLAETDPGAGKAAELRLARALSDWTSQRLAAWVRRNRETLRRYLAGSQAELVVQEARREGDLANALVRIRVEGRHWDGRVHLHRQPDGWRVHDAETAGVALQDVLRVLWLDARRDSATPLEAAEALVELSP